MSIGRKISFLLTAVCALALLDALLEDGRFPQPDPQVMQDC